MTTMTLQQFATMVKHERQTATHAEPPAKPKKPSLAERFQNRLNQRVPLGQYGNLELGLSLSHPGIAVTVSEVVRQFVEHHKRWTINGLNRSNVEEAASQYADTVDFAAEILKSLEHPAIFNKIALVGDQAGHLFNTIIEREPVLGKEEVDQAIGLASGARDAASPETGRMGQAVSQAVQYARYNQPAMAKLWSTRNGNVFKKANGQALLHAGNAARMCAMILTLAALTDRRLAAAM